MVKKLILPAVVFAAVALFSYTKEHRGLSLTAPQSESLSDDGVLRRAFESRADGAQVEGQGIVVKVLADDNDGSRHQRFILQVGSGQTVLIAHNIDLAPRVSPLTEGDIISFNGEYAWNEKGGVVHWTHHDPQGRHSAGWIKRKGQTFE
ncbi:MAG: DUF3465 domain-containing protein [Gammaproteobacteria bacterium]